MTWCNESNDVETVETNNSSSSLSLSLSSSLRNRSCPSCGHQIEYCQQQGSRINELPGLPAGVRFDPTDQELIKHLEGKVKSNGVHPLIDEFIPTLEGENGICYTHPEKLPGVTKNGQVRHFFHRPSRAYTTGTRKRRKVDTDEDGSETRWHKTGKTRPVLMDNKVIKGYKKILVLYTNYGKQRKPEKTNWIMHQYHLGMSEDEKDGELVVSKVFYQTQPRQCGGGSVLKLKMGSTPRNEIMQETNNCSDHNHPSMISFDQRGIQAKGSASTTTIFPFCCPSIGGSVTKRS